MTWEGLADGSYVPVAVGSYDPSELVPCGASAAGACACGLHLEGCRAERTAGHTQQGPITMAVHRAME